MCPPDKMVTSLRRYDTQLLRRLSVLATRRRTRVCLLQSVLILNLEVPHANVRLATWEMEPKQAEVALERHLWVVCSNNDALTWRKCFDALGCICILMHFMCLCIESLIHMQQLEVHSPGISFRKGQTATQAGSFHVKFTYVIWHMDITEEKLKMMSILSFSQLRVVVWIWYAINSVVEAQATVWWLVSLSTLWAGKALPTIFLGLLRYSWYRYNLAYFPFSFSWPCPWNFVCVWYTQVQVYHHWQILSKWANIFVHQHTLRLSNLQKGMAQAVRSSQS